MVGVSTFPFAMFGGDRADRTLAAFASIPQRGDTTIGNDVWIGREAIIMPGVTIADGAIIGAHSVITKDVGPYEVVAGNPGRVVRVRYTPSEVETMLKTKWWEWTIETISTHPGTLMTGTPADIAANQAAAIR